MITPPENNIQNSQPQKLACELCGKQFSKLYINIHMMLHSATSQFHCSIDTCQKSFSTSSRLKNHMKIHQPRRREFICSVCTKAFLTNRHLVAHSVVHFEEKPYQCSSCEKRFKSLHAKGLHEKIHKRIRCEKCGREFKRKLSLVTHDSIHSGIKQFYCTYPGCEKAFAGKSSLSTHMLRHVRIVQLRNDTAFQAVTHEFFEIIGSKESVENGKMKDMRKMMMLRKYMTVRECNDQTESNSTFDGE